MLISDLLARVALYYRDSQKDQEIPDDGCIGIGIYFNPTTNKMQAVVAVDDWGSEEFADLLRAIVQEVQEKAATPLETHH